MICFHNLEFFDKTGNNLNLYKKKNVIVTVIDNVNYPQIPGSGAQIDVITNYNAQLEDFIIINGGSGYSENTVINVSDVITGNSYTIDEPNFITRDNTGKIIEIILNAPIYGYTYPAQIYTGEMFFNEVSVGLLESEHIYMAERVISNTQNKYISPRNSLFKDGTTTNYFNISVDQEDPEIFLYDITNKNDSHPLIEKYEEFQLTIDNGENDVFDNSKTRILDYINNNVIQINIAVRADEEGIYENFLRLQVIHNGEKFSFAEIFFRAEVIGEDERLKTMLDTFGFAITNEEVKIFRDSDINESLPNYVLLNEKRKEMLLEYHNIFPYIGSYKGLINILKYFDYSDLRLKEYWLNTEMAQRDEMIPNLNKNESLTQRSPVIIPQKPVDINSMVSFLQKYKYIPNYGLNRSLKFIEKYYKQVNVPFDLKNKNKNTQDESFLPSSVWKKTSLFSLHYDINKETSDLDTDGLPIVVDAFMFSEEEALIKLFTLKNYLKERFLPLNARIIDIVGEGVYFTRYALNSWSDGTNTTYIIKDFKPNFNIVSTYLIEDLHNYGEHIENFDTTSIIGSYYQNTLFNFTNTNNIATNNVGPVGCLIHLETDNFDITWDDMNILWDEILTSNINNQNDINTWDTIGQNEYFELEWRITYNIPAKYSFKIRKKIKEGKKITVAVPFTGEYKIDLVLFDMTNHSVKCSKYVNVIMPEIEVTLLSRFQNYTESWEDFENNDISWDTVGGDWRCSGLQNNVTWDDCQLTWDELEIQNHNLTSPNEQFDLGQSANILKISEADRYVGTVQSFNIDLTNNIFSITCLGQYVQPKLRNALGQVILDYVFCKRDEIIFKVGVISADYSVTGKTIVYVTSIPDGFNTSWDLLREIKQTILIENDVSFNAITNQNGLKPDTYIKLEYDEANIPNVSRIPINDLYPSSVSTANDIQGISLNTSINKIANEFGKIYKVRNATTGVGIDTFNIDIINKTIQLNYTVEPDEIIPGFTEIKMTTDINGILYTQRLRVHHYNSSSQILNLIELDGDISLANSYTSIIEYEYYQFNAKLVHFEYGVGTDLILNFNDYPVNLHFYNLVSTPNTYQLNGTWYFDYVTRDGDYSLLIKNIGFDNNNTLITVDDPESELYKVGPQFKFSWITFDQDYAEKRLGIDNFSWENMNNVKWDELYHLQWKHLEYYPGVSCGFEITKIAQSGSIRFNELPEFIFNSIPAISIGTPNITEYDQFIAAIFELNNTDNEAMSKFSFRLDTTIGTPTLYKIIATAKTRSIDSLGYLTFSNGVESNFSDPTVGHTYPIGTYTQWNTPYVYGLNNLFANWLPVARTYYEYGYNPSIEKGWYPAVQYVNDNGILVKKIYEPIKVSSLTFDPADINDPIYGLFPSLLNSVEWKYAESLRCLYDHVIAGPFTWDDFFVSTKSVTLKKFTTIFFLLSNCKIAGKHKYKWQLIDKLNQTLLCEIIKNELIWTFDVEGVYDLKVEIEDINGNVKTIQKNAYITIIK